MDCLGSAIDCGVPIQSTIMATMNNKTQSDKSKILLAIAVTFLLAASASYICQLGQDLLGNSPSSFHQNRSSHAP
jgi:hypothetical protein